MISLSYGPSQPIRLLILPVKDQSRELTVYPRSHIRRRLQVSGINPMLADLLQEPCRIIGTQSVRYFLQTFGVAGLNETIPRAPGRQRILKRPAIRIRCSLSSLSSVPLSNRHYFGNLTAATSRQPGIDNDPTTGARVECASQSYFPSRWSMYLVANCSDISASIDRLSRPHDTSALTTRTLRLAAPKGPLFLSEAPEKA